MAATIAAIVLFFVGVIGIFSCGSLIKDAMIANDHIEGKKWACFAAFFASIVLLAHWVAK